MVGTVGPQPIKSVFTFFDIPDLDIRLAHILSLRLISVIWPFKAASPFRKLIEFCLDWRIALP